MKSNYKALYEENVEHKNNTRFENHFQYPKHCLHLVEKTPSSSHIFMIHNVICFT